MAKAFVLFAFTLFVLFAGACGEVDDQPLAGIGESSDQQSLDEDEDGVIDGVPEAVNGIFTVEQLQAFVNAGLHIYLGDQPTTVEGNYYANSLRITYDAAGYSGYFAPYIYRFSEQTEEQTLLIGYTGEAQDSSSGNLGYIAGSEECFSLFTDIEGYSEGDDCTYTRSTVITGCLDDEGSIVNFAFGFIMTSTTGDCSATMPEGHMRVVKENDKLVVPN